MNAQMAQSNAQAAQGNALTDYINTQNPYSALPNLPQQVNPYYAIGGYNPQGNG
jgi:hypothetical protein